MPLDFLLHLVVSVLELAAADDRRIDDKRFRPVLLHAATAKHQE